MEIALEAREIIKDYPGVRAVDGVSFAVRDGLCFGLLGPNGAGKTTTIEIIEGVTDATSGGVWYRGEPAGRRFREEVGIQFQDTALQDHLRVGETLVMFQKLYNRRGNLESVIDDCALRDLLDRDNKKLSGGQRQRLLLAVALVNEPRIVFLDEPTTGLDPQARRNFWDLVRHIRDKGTTIILTTHYMEEAQILCDEIAIMDTGKIIAQGRPTDLLRERYKNVIIELPTGDVSDSLGGLVHKTFDARGVVEIETDDVNASLAELSTRNVSLQHLRIREPNLEDLFIDLTGHSLRA